MSSESIAQSILAWNRCNMLVHFWLFNSVSELIAQSIVFMENAIDVWNDLKEILFRLHNCNKKFMLLNKIQSL